MAVVLRGGAEEGVGEEKLQRELEMADWKGRPLGGSPGQGACVFWGSMVR